MITERIALIFRVLGCSSSDVARFAGCSPSYISLLRSGKRALNPESPSTKLLSRGIFKFAESYSLLDKLAMICQANDVSEATLTSIIASWIFQEGEIAYLQTTPWPEQSRRRKSASLFGDRLNSTMNVLNLSNANLAKHIHVDDSHISRFRNGLRSPLSNPTLKQTLAEFLFCRAAEKGKLPMMSELMNVNPETLAGNAGLDVFCNWLFSEKGETEASAVGNLLRSIGAFSAGTSMKLEDPYAIPTEALLEKQESVYWGSDGLQKAVIRFLLESGKKASELCLYSDENMKWLTSNPEYLRKWAALMSICIRNGASIKIIHNIDRNASEMLEAINNWLPLYMTGRIESHAYPKRGDMRFSHTLFLCTGTAAVSGFHVRGAEDNGYYEYISDSRMRLALEREYNALWSRSEPLIRIFSSNERLRIFDQNHHKENQRELTSLLSSPSVETMPEGLMKEMLNRNSIPPLVQARIIDWAEKRKQRFNATLKSGRVWEFLPAATQDELIAGKVKLNLSSMLLDIDIPYTPDDYARHQQSVGNLLKSHPAYQVTPLHRTPFPEVQIIRQDECVMIMRHGSPQVAFVIMNPMMIRAFDEFFQTVKPRQALRRDSS